MKNYVGIDLGTSNSVICSYDGEQTRIWKSPEQNEVTPSAIYFGKRGNRYVGKAAYDQAAHDPDSSALGFKRMMGTSNRFLFASTGEFKSPEECSAEVLKTLFGYLPEEVRLHQELGSVITVPAAFNQMQKDATLQASTLAGIGKVALMQEPVAAIMCVMKARPGEGMFLVFDLGGGTLDVAIAEALGGKVNLLSTGGIAMCGGRDFDRLIVDDVVKKWLESHFELPKDWANDPSYKLLHRKALWAAERAKIELSSRDEAVINVTEQEMRYRDLKGKEVYLDIPISRAQFDQLIDRRVTEAVVAAREVLAKAGLNSKDLERIVFVGGPTQYKPLRDKVCRELGVPGSGEVDPMTAVAVGASIFAESIDWSSREHSKKNVRGRVLAEGPLAIAFDYLARTPEKRTKVIARLGGKSYPGYEFQLDSLDTGWTSGRTSLTEGGTLDVPLSKDGDNSFNIQVFDASGRTVDLSPRNIRITKTLAAVGAIPASHSIGVEVLDRLGGAPVLEWLVRAGDPLPRKGKKVFRAAEALKAGDANSLNFRLWEGEIETPINHNRLVGVLKISGTDFAHGVIATGADLECTYEVLDSGTIRLEVAIPSIGASFESGRNFYSRQEGQLDFGTAALQVQEETENALDHVEKLSEAVADPRLDGIRNRLEDAAEAGKRDSDPEQVQAAREEVLAAKRELAAVRKDHLRDIREQDLNDSTEFFDKCVREHARPSEIESFEQLARTAQRSLDRGDKEFEFHLSAMQTKNIEILWRQDWFIVNRFEELIKSPKSFSDPSRLRELIATGQAAIKANDMTRLRQVLGGLYQLKVSLNDEEELLQQTNILRG
jgi:molecular chaperone DnaK